MSKDYLRIQQFTLAQQARILRRREASARKWDKREKPKPDESIDALMPGPGTRKYEYTLRRGFRPDLREELHHHRVKLRPRVRALHVALGFMRGTPYRKIEAFALSSPDWKQIWRNVTKHGSVEDTYENQQEFMWWADEGAGEIKQGHNQRRRDYTARLREPRPSILIAPIFKNPDAP